LLGGGQLRERIGGPVANKKVTREKFRSKRRAEKVTSQPLCETKGRTSHKKGPGFAASPGELQVLGKKEQKKKIKGAS